MKLSEFKSIITDVDSLKFTIQNGKNVPAHYHVTEVGSVEKHFIDCGGTIRKEKTVSFQLWYSVDLHHRMSAQKMLDIINIAEQKLGVEDGEIEVEYQSETIGKYGLDFNGEKFVLTNKSTACLASDACGIPGMIAEKISLPKLNVLDNCCTPGGGCC